MSNEELFIIIMLSDLAFVFFCYLLGKNFLYVAVISNIMFTNMVSSKLVTVLGLDQTVANVFYAAIFLATDLLSEHHGTKAARRAVWMGFVALLPLLVFGPLVAQFEPAASAGTAVHDALATIFSYTPRIIVASIVAYLIAQHTDVLLYERIRAWRPGTRFLWLRNNGSTIVSQFIDQAVFVSLAFAGAVPTPVLIQIFIAGYAVKLLVALVDTPFIYLSKIIPPRGAHRE